MIYLRRMLFRFRLFVGGKPAFLKLQEVTSEVPRHPRKHLSLSATLGDREFQVFEVAPETVKIPSEERLVQVFHSTSLTPGDRERNRPLVLQYAGGKL